MFVRGLSYRSTTALCKCAALGRRLTIPTCALLLGGCASMGLPVSDFQSVDPVQTGAVAAPGAAAAAGSTVDASDWETVRRTIAGVPVTDSGRFGWNNPGTRSSGNVTVLALGTNGNSASCRPFATTINDMRGVRGYRGRACWRADGQWYLEGVSADDTTLL